MSVQKNVNTFYYYKMTSGAIIIGPIIVLYLLNVKNLSFTEVMLLNSVAALATVLFEVPTGVVADKWGRKVSLLLGSVFLAFSLALYVVASGFWICLLAEVLFSLGFAFNSGADTALLYDSLLEMKQESEFQRIAGKAQSNLYWVQAIGSIAAGFLYENYVHLPLIISVVFMIVSFFIVLFFQEPICDTDDTHKLRSYRQQVIESGKYIFSHTKIKALLFYCTVFFIFYRMGFYLFQPYMTSVGLPVKFIGIMFFLFNVVAAITSSNSHKIMSITKHKTLSILSSLVILSFLLMGLSKAWYGSFAIFLQQIARGLYYPVTRKYFNKHISSDIRATTLSFISLITRLATSFIFPLLGIVKDKFSIYATHTILAITMLIFTAISLVYIKDKLGTQLNTKLPHSSSDLIAEKTEG